MDEHAKGVQQSIESIIGADTVLKRRKKTEDDISRDTFEKIIIALEQANVRSSIIGGDFKLDFTSYDETFYEIIDNLILMQFGKEASEVIFFYVYERMNPDGSINELRDTNDTPIVLNNPTDLWDLINVIRNASSKTTK